MLHVSRVAATTAISDGTCTADPSGKPIDGPNIPAYTTEYVEQRINTVGGGTFDNSPVPTTTTLP